MMTLTEFLLARIAEDEACAALVAADKTMQGVDASYDTEAAIMSLADRAASECEAKRRIVQRSLDLIASFGDWDANEAMAFGGHREMWEGVTRRERSHAHDTLRVLAEPYASHYDYDEDWRP